MIDIYGTVKEVIPKLLELDAEKKYLFTIKEPHQKRSLAQNRYLWKLVHLIAKETYQDDYEIYCAMLERANALSDYVITAYDMEDTLRKHFRGVRFIRKQDVNGKECHIYKVYIGSSKMNTKEMTELIDTALQICSELLIDTRGLEYE